MAKSTKKQNLFIEDEFELEMDDNSEELEFDDFDFEDEDDMEIEDDVFEDEDDEDEFEEDDEPEEEPEPVKPVKKPAPKQQAVKAKPQVKTQVQQQISKKQIKQANPATEEVKKEKAPSGKVRKQAKLPKEHATYEKLMETVTAKVDAYDKIMEERAYNKTTALPQSTAISKELFVKLLVAKASEENDKGMKVAMQKAMVSMGFDSDDVKDALSTYHFKETEMNAIYVQMFELMYDVLSAGSGFPLFKNDDCNSTLEGRWTDEVIKDNAHLNTDKATKIDSFLKLTCKSTAPAGKKQQGHIKGNKFVPIKK